MSHFHLTTYITRAVAFTESWYSGVKWMVEFVESCATYSSRESMLNLSRHDCGDVARPYLLSWLRLARPIVFFTVLFCM